MIHKIRTRWETYAIVEGLSKTLSMLGMKHLGSAVPGISGALFFSFCIGCTQAIGGLLIALKRGASWASLFKGTSSALFFALIAMVGTVLGIWAFSYPGSDAGVGTYIILLSTIVGGLYDRIFFGVKLNLRQWAGIALLVLGFFFMMDFQVTWPIPTWMCIFFLIVLVHPLNEVIAKGFGLKKGNDPYVFNFLVGLFSALLSLGAFFVLGAVQAPTIPSTYTVLVAVLIGGNVLVMILCKVLSYTFGGNIALKLLVMYAAHLSTAIIAGAIVFANETLTVGKVLGMCIFPVAYFLYRGDSVKGDSV